MRSTMYFFEKYKYLAPPTRFVDPTTKIYTHMFAAPLLKHNSCFKSQDVLASTDSLLKLWDCLWWMMRSQVTLWRKQYTCRVWFTSSTDLSPPLFRHINACHKLACWLANTFYHSIYRRSGCKGFDPCASKKVFFVTVTLGCAGRRDLRGSFGSWRWWGWCGWGRGWSSPGSSAAPPPSPPPGSGRFCELLGSCTQYEYKTLQWMGVEIYIALMQDNDKVLTCPPSFSDEHSECRNWQEADPAQAFHCIYIETKTLD